MKSRLVVLASTLVFIGFVNFLSFIVESELIGGSALNGYRLNGEFYVSWHGQETEVDEATWWRSRWHAISLFATHPMAIISWAYLATQCAFPMLLYRTTPQVVDETERYVRESGPPLARFVWAGRIGALIFSGKILRVVTYPQGLWIKPRFIPAIAIKAIDITSIREKRELLSSGVEILHSFKGIDSPVMLVPKGRERKLMVGELLALVANKQGA